MENTFSVLVRVTVARIFLVKSIISIIVCYLHMTSPPFLIGVNIILSGSHVKKVQDIFHERRLSAEMPSFAYVTDNHILHKILYIRIIYKKILHYSILMDQTVHYNSECFVVPVSHVNNKKKEREKKKRDNR